jgi:guanylate kinase
MIQDGFIPVLEIETDGAEQVMKKLDRYQSVYLSPPDYATLELRLRGRGTETEEAITKRLATAREEIHKSSLYKNVILNYNDRAQDAAQAIVDLIQTGTTESDVLVRDREQFLASFQA